MTELSTMFDYKKIVATLQQIAPEAHIAGGDPNAVRGLLNAEFILRPKERFAPKVEGARGIIEAV